MIKSFSFNSSAPKELNSRKLFIISICSMLGVGIFLKSKTLIELSNQNFWPILVLFCISAGLIISMCWAFTRLVDKKTSSSRGFIEWVEEYCGSNFKSWALEFTTKLLHPLGILTTSIYLIKWINGQHFLWVWEASICAIVISFLVISLNVFSFKGAVLLQKCLSFSIFLAILYTLGFGIHSYFVNESDEKTEQSTTQLTGLNSLGGWTILLSGLPSIFFMYDGFYSVLALKEKTAKKTSFRKIVSLSFIAITLIYFLVISITLLGEGNTGDFLKFKKLVEDKNFKDVLIILIFLTFLSSLNVACMCGLNQVIQLHYKYNFRDLGGIRDRFFKVGNRKYSLETKLSVWFYFLRQIAGVALIMATISQLIYWAKGGNELLWEINDILAELNSLIIFGILGMVLWNSRRELKANYLTSISILIAIIYFLLNNVVGLFYGNGKLIISIFKLLIFGAMLLYPAIPLLKAKISKSFSMRDLEPKRFNKLNQEYSLIKLAVR
ncbi:permease subunit, similiar to amino acid transporter subunit [Mycoplasma wenyonii str. Massachusetts]|uniref:Permease subunit, similiar to amino acid transporter subunit n=1 Tax=Mycoplasma wenyonii (strain Massachusetts) TaxID=1197325 RepID=I6ZF08_MYCWM|nr:amino acid permease [Mycoplasma wenyonii]AFN65197.1 permease subunit, similiar to amino acid transporter subunit [Mycoplasma wenyonii str. Massachusetts]